MVVLFNFFSLGIAEIAVIVIAIIILIDPKNAKMIKPWVKKVYRSWLTYRDEVTVAEKEMEEMKRTVLKPIKDAEREVEAEINEQVRTAKSPFKKAQKDIASKIKPKQYLGKMSKTKGINPIKEIRGELQKEKRTISINPIDEIRNELRGEKSKTRRNLKKRKARKGRK